MASLIVSFPAGEKTVFELTSDHITVGRSLENRIAIRDERVSSFHAEIRRDGAGRFGLRDLGSSNGTLVNGKRINECVLQDGDQLSFGTVAAEFCMVASEEPERAMVEGDVLRLVRQVRSHPDEGGAARRVQQYLNAARDRAVRERVEVLVAQEREKWEAEARSTPVPKPGRPVPAGTRGGSAPVPRSSGRAPILGDSKAPNPEITSFLPPGQRKPRN